MPNRDTQPWWDRAAQDEVEARHPPGARTDDPQTRRSVSAGALLLILVVGGALLLLILYVVLGDEPGQLGSLL